MQLLKNLWEILNKPFSLFSIPIIIHWSWYWMMVFAVLIDVNYFVFLLGSFLLVFLHELGHVFATLQLKGSVNSIEIYPLGGIVKGSVETNWNNTKDLIITAAGPLVDLLLIPILLLLRSFSPSGLVSNYLDFLLFVNYILLFFNTIPAYPNDGGNVLKIILSIKYDLYTSIKISIYTTFVMAIIIAFFAILYELWFLLVCAFFLHYIAQREWNLLAKNS